MIERYAKGDQVPLNWYRLTNCHPMHFGTDVEVQVINGVRMIWIARPFGDDGGHMMKADAIVQDGDVRIEATIPVEMYGWTRAEHGARSAAEKP